MKRIYLIALWVALMLAVSACASATPAPVQATPDQAVEQDQPEPTQAAEPEPVVEAPEATTVVEPTAEPAPPVEIRQELAATDPATVNLASGTPTFVEFFAFW